MQIVMQISRSLSPIISHINMYRFTHIMQILDFKEFCFLFDIGESHNEVWVWKNPITLLFPSIILDITQQYKCVILENNMCMSSATAGSKHNALGWEALFFF